MPITGGSYTQHDIPENGRNSPSVLENDRKNGRKSSTVLENDGSSSGNSSDSEQKNDTKFLRKSQNGSHWVFENGATSSSSVDGDGTNSPNVNGNGTNSPSSVNENGRNSPSVNGNGANSPSVNGNEIFFPSSPWPITVTSSSLHLGGSPISQNITENNGKKMENNGRRPRKIQDSDSDSDYYEEPAVTAENFFNSADPLFSNSVIFPDIESGDGFEPEDNSYSEDLNARLVPTERQPCLIAKMVKNMMQTLRHHRYHLLGITLANLSGFIFTINNCIIQTLNLDFSEIMLIRGTIQLMILSIIICANGYSLLPKIGEHPWRVRLSTIFQGLWGGLMVICSVSCVTFMPLGDAMTLLFTAPLSTMIVAAVFLGHRLRLYRIFNAFLLIAGAVLVIRPSFIFDNKDIVDNDPLTENLNNTESVVFGQVLKYRYTVDYHNYWYYVGAIIAISSALSDGFLNITINYCKDVESIVLLWWAGFGAIVCSLIGFSFDPDARMLSPEITEIPYTHWIAYVGIAYMGMLGYYCMTKSLQLVDPTVVAFIRSLEIVFGYVFQVAIMHQIPTVLSLVGAGFVLISVLFISLQDVLIEYIPERVRFLF